MRTARRLALASVVANSAIVVTGGAVRLTSSGLGCPTWPKCTTTTLTPTPEYAAHGVIEFGNRLLTFVLLAVVVPLLVAVWRIRPVRSGLRRLAVLGVLGVLLQAAIGGVTVLTGLNPWTVMGHFLVSSVLITLAVVLHHRIRTDGAAPAPGAPLALRRLGTGLLVVVAATLVAGTVVTGSGPHAGDEDAPRTGFDPETVSQVHADLVFLLVGLTLAFWVALKASGAPRQAVRAMGLLLVVELAQGVIGFAQYFTDLPVVLVGLHLVGACLIVVAAVHAVLALQPTPAAEPADERLGSAPEVLHDRGREAVSRAG